MYVEKIKNARKNILTGEIGALLHDIGKCHPYFVKSKSIENIKGLPHHAREIDRFVDSALLNLFRIVKVKFDNDEKSVYDFIRDHHNAKGNLLKGLEKCDRLDSADDKGIVRKKQSIEDTIIGSPFGYPKEKIDIQCLEKRFTDLQDNLCGLFKNYVDDTLTLSCFRESLLMNLKTTFTHALGETRIPANDVTLWDHSHSIASLFKSVLCMIALGENSDSQWRLFGFCWDGIGFINKGKKIADILKRNEIIEEIKIELKKKFEDEIPIGNAIYEDINGIYFTFPALSDKSDKAKELAKECAKEGLKIIRDKSDNEIWPFFTLGKPSRSLTILTNELSSAAEKRNIPKISPRLFVDGGESIRIDSNTDMPIPEDGEDLCPVCRLRTKPVSDERCNICEERRKGRLQDWFNNKENTIWTDEVADKNNRVTLLSLNFNLYKWLDGTMVRTIYSQTFEDWENGIKKGKDTIQLLKAANIDTVIKSNKETVYSLLDEVINNSANDKKKPAQILNTFFQDINIAENQFDEHITNIKNRIGTDELTKENLAVYLFTQNPSPARLYRIWRETEEFFEVVVREIKEKLYPHKWKRISFKVNVQNLKLKNSKKLEPNTPYIIKIKELEPETLLVLHASDGKFSTIESLEKFRFKEKSGSDAIQDAIESGFYWLAEEDEPNKNLLSDGHNAKGKNIEQEDYYPFIEITKSPLSLRLIVPAADAIKILDLIVKLYNQSFERAMGKLPLYVGLLVMKRKFPLYVLLDAAERLFHGQEFAEPERMDPWWNIKRINKYYGFYPTKKLDEKEKYTLDDLAQLSKGKQYSLYTGYFDFDLLLGTDDRYKITYEKKRRADEEYKLFSKRPYYFYQISEMIDLWQILKNNLSSSQINFIEESLTGKLREWRDVKDAERENIFKRFAEATLKDAFGDRWKNFRPETQGLILNSVFNGLLLDTIVLFRHIIKEGEDEENG
ncbi:MAG: CRISPR-associated protein Csx11 [Candidatus Methanofastidiosa archaeon]|nr:CRISPR-associated protein Csx11 [Candidatus Methanofastidiosa archaeon]